ncbi:HNH endonuclease signature motif containing protein [Paenarthrobacter sp. PH39-S1]|uniref:HNH endonuclease signature motif containing protein n=1 Tax=Paenarthrobacter sp. PH39-S1 TaxID=3046204 RepID=UPI0024BBDFAB|nr:HNH endonuclease signature motif containing protein [Paenarthrobacter sp. PH39-S1]MDJ0357680.1 HNH endonuclease signature motif containing protein [Paenarthrobacter sp. PH39-S1]
MERTWSELDSHNVAKAIELWHELGNEEFISRTRFKESKRYVVIDQGQLISSKPLLAMAFQLQFSCSKDGPPSLTGGDQTRSILKRLRYDLIDLRTADQNQLFEPATISIDPSTKFWWANQTANFDTVFQEGTLWAPRSDSRGRQVDHWRNLDSASPGDVVFHYGTPEIRGVSRVETMPGSTYAPHGYAESGTKTAGNLVLTKPISRVQVHRDLALRTLASDKYGPVNTLGGLRNGYFFPLNTEGALALLGQAGVKIVTETASTDVLHDITSEPAFEGLSDKSSIVAVRREQRFLRDQQLKRRGNVCSLCGESFPTAFLVAAHIKPRWACTEDERMDIHHVSMLACLFGCDALFELGYIAINDDGKIEHGSQGFQQVEHKTKCIIGLTCLAFNDQSREYYSWHRQHHANSQNKLH